MQTQTLGPDLELAVPQPLPIRKLHVLGHSTLRSESLNLEAEPSSKKEESAGERGRGRGRRKGETSGKGLNERNCLKQAPWAWSPFPHEHP